MEIRQIQLGERAAYEKLSARGFTYPYKEEPEAWAKEAAAMRQYHGAFDEKGRLCSAMIQLDYGCHFGGQETKLLGIGGVVSDPALRRNGGIRALFEEGLPRARREGYTFSALYPFSHVFYRKFGYELAQVSREAVLEPQALRDDLRGAAEISLVLPEDAEGHAAVRQVYEDYARERNLSLHRDDALWERKWKGATLEQMKYLYLLRDAAGTPVAYWLGEVETQPGGMKGLHLTDMAWRRLEGLEAIFAMLRGSNEFVKVRLLASADVELRYFLKEPYQLEEKTFCNGMARVLDVRRALAMMPAPALPGKCVLRVQDAQIAENCGVFRITGDGRELLVEDAETEAADIETDIGGLTLLVLGSMDIAQFAMQRRGAVWRVTPFMQLLFTRRGTFLHDAF